MKILNGENKQSSIYLLPDYNSKSGYKLKYMGAKYQRPMMLTISIKYEDKQIILKDETYINIYSLMIEKHIDNKLKEETEMLLGTNKKYIKKAYNLIKKYNISFEHIETILDKEFNMPCIKCYDELIERKAYEIIDKYMKDNKYINEIINKGTITIKKEFKDNIELF